MQSTQNPSALDVLYTEMEEINHAVAVVLRSRGFFEDIVGQDVTDDEWNVIVELFEDRVLDFLSNDNDFEVELLALARRNIERRGQS
jgi:hypothetical protein